MQHDLNVLKDFWWGRKKARFASLSVTVSFHFSVYWWKKNGMSLLLTPRFLLFVFYGELCGRQKSGVKEGVNVKGNWRWQIIVGNWKSCREGVAAGDEVAQCFGNTPNATSFHLISSFPLTSSSFLPSAPITLPYPPPSFLPCVIVLISAEVLCIFHIYFNEKMELLHMVTPLYPKILVPELLY